MSMQVSINNRVGPQLAAINDSLKSRSGIHKTMAQEVAVSLRKHFLNLNASKANSKGWPRQNFWNRFGGTKTTSTGNDAEGTVTIADPQGALRHKINGGTVKPKRGKFLLIPLTAAAYRLLGRATARTAFPDAFVLKKQGRMLLARNNGKSLQVLARLLPSVTHAAEPDALPSSQDMESTAVEGARKYLNLQLRRSP